MNNPNSASHWDDKWLNHEKAYLDAHEVMYQAVRPYMKGEVADLGCGNAYIGNDAGSRYHGIDISEEGIKKAKAYNPQGEFVVGDARTTPWANRSFDTVMLLAVVEHFENYMPVLWEAKRICRGRIVCILPWQSRGAEHYHPHWPIEKVVDAFLTIGEVVEYRQVPHPNGKWILVVTEVV